MGFGVFGKTNRVKYWVGPCRVFVLASVAAYVEASPSTKFMARKPCFYLERPRPGKDCLILLRFVWSGRTVQISTSEFVQTEHWDSTTQRVTDKYCRLRPDYLEVNRILDKLDQFTRRTYNEYRRDHRLLELTPASMKGMIASQIYGADYIAQKQDSTVASYYRTYVNQREEAGNLSRQTEKSDRVAMQHFCRFSEIQAHPPRFKDVTLGLFERYRDHFWQQEEERADSTIYKYLRKLKQVCLHAAATGDHELGSDVRSVHLSSHLRLSAQAMDTLALYDEELVHLAAFEWPGHPSHLEVRDLFIAGCCTGLRVNRWPQISAANIIILKGQRMLSLFTQKGTRKKVVIPLRPMLERIGERYDWNLPKHSPVMINRYIKEVCQAAGMSDEVELARNVRGRSVLQRYRKYELITSHTARRSFATNAHAAGIHLDDIQAMTGHSDRKTLLHYIKEDAERRATRLKALPYYTDTNAPSTQKPKTSVSA